jgi:hypothetical protein
VTSGEPDEAAAALAAIEACARHLGLESELHPAIAMFPIGVASVRQSTSSPTSGPSTSSQTKVDPGPDESLENDRLEIDDYGNF